jgi:hypothetical protein
VDKQTRDSPRSLIITLFQLVGASIAGIGVLANVPIFMILLTFLANWRLDSFGLKHHIGTFTFFTKEEGVS